MVAFLLLMLLSSSCDGRSYSLGGGFEILEINQANPGLHYNGASLVDRKYEITKVKWNDSYILVLTSEKQLILVDRKKVIADQAYTGAGVRIVSFSEVKKMTFDDSLDVSSW